MNKGNMTSVTLDGLALYGPVQEKNKAHVIVRYVFYSLVGAKFSLLPSTQAGPVGGSVEYEPQISRMHYVEIKRNSLGHVEVFCPNGKTYNLSCALRNANLDYFRLLAEEDGSVFDILGRKKSELKTLHDIFEVEKNAITSYTKSSQYKKMNALLRGLPVSEFDQAELKKLIITSLLAISGVNKNVDPNPTVNETKTIIRQVQNLPIDILAQMSVGLGCAKLTGLTSYSENIDGAAYFDDQAFAIRMHDVSGRLSNAAYSIVPSESEVIQPPQALRFLSWDYLKDKNNKMVLDVEVLNGLTAENHNHYLSELALIEAYEKHLKNPYRIDNDIFEGINRPNHALAHHVRVVSYILPVINYLANYADDENLRDFCKKISLDDIELLKVMAAFSKTGRESEVSPLMSDGRVNPLYIEFQNKSAQNLTLFLREHTNLSATEIAVYDLVMRKMGDPNPEYIEVCEHQYRESVIKNHDEMLFMNHILSLSHKLDLPRCYTPAEFDQSVKNYSYGSVVKSSKEQEDAFSHLLEIAFYAIANTGSRLQNARYRSYDFNGLEFPDQFKRCNSDVFYCISRCEFASLLCEMPIDKRASLGKVEEESRFLQVLKKNAPLISSELGVDPVFKSQVLDDGFKRRVFECLVKNIDRLDLNIGEIKLLMDSVYTGAEKRELVFDFLCSDFVSKISKFNDLVFVLNMNLSNQEQIKFLEAVFTIGTDIDRFDMNDVKSIIEMDCITPETMEWIISFFSCEGGDLKELIFLLELTKISESRKKSLFDKFALGDEKIAGVVMDDKNCRLLFKYMPYENKKGLFDRFGEYDFTGNNPDDSMLIFFRYFKVDILKDSDLDMFFSARGRFFSKYLLFNLKNDPADKGRYLKWLINDFDKLTAKELRIILEETQIEKNDRLTLFLCIRNREIKDELSSSLFSFSDIDISLAELIEVSDFFYKFERLVESGDAKYSRDFMIAMYGVIREPLNSEFLKIVVDMLRLGSQAIFQQSSLAFFSSSVGGAKLNYHLKVFEKLLEISFEPVCGLVKK